jgi:hypothetical protein
VFRTNIAHNRNIEARTKLQEISAQWASCCSTMLAFEATDISLKREKQILSRRQLETGPNSNVRDANTNADVYPHLLENVVAHPNGDEAAQAEQRVFSGGKPQTMATWLEEDIERFSLFCGELLHRFSLLQALCFMHLRMDDDLKNLVLHSRVDAGRSGRHLDIHGLPLEWQDYFVLRTNPEWHKKNASVAKIPVLPSQSGQTLSAEEGRMLSSMAERLFERGLSIEAAPERVYAVHSWVQVIIARKCDPDVGWQCAPPPTSAGVWRSLEAGLAAFEQCRKIAETPFNFPWAQLMVVLLTIYSLTLPLVMVGWLKAAWIAIVLDFVSVLSYWSMNEVARGLESPFLFPPNDLPLVTLQYRFNQRLLATANGILKEGGSSAFVCGYEY